MIIQTYQHTPKVIDFLVIRVKMEIVSTNGLIEARGTLAML